MDWALSLASVFGSSLDPVSGCCQNQHLGERNKVFPVDQSPGIQRKRCLNSSANSIVWPGFPGNAGFFGGVL